MKWYKFCCDFFFEFLTWLQAPFPYFWKKNNTRKTIVFFSSIRFSCLPFFFCCSSSFWFLEEQAVLLKCRRRDMFKEDKIYIFSNQMASKAARIAVHPSNTHFRIVIVKSHLLDTLEEVLELVVALWTDLDGLKTSTRCRSTWHQTRMEPPRKTMLQRFESTRKSSAERFCAQLSGESIFLLEPTADSCFSTEVAKEKFIRSSTAGDSIKWLCSKDRTSSWRFPAGRGESVFTTWVGSSRRFSVQR